MAKVPFVKKLLAFAVGKTCSVSKDTNYYSGTPTDYVDVFVKLLDSFPEWDPIEKSWTKKIMNNAGTVEEGIRAMTERVVDDDEGETYTNHFTEQQKSEIVDCLLSDESYLQIAREHLAPLLKEESL